MRTKSSASDSWKLFLLGALFGCLWLLIYINQVHQNIKFLSATNYVVEFSRFNLIRNPIIDVKKTSNYIRDAMHEHKNKSVKKCNIFEGRWVYKPKERSIYDSFTCPFLEEKMSCKDNGRPDLLYEKWRWEARDCDIPLFNGTNMLQRLRNKRMIIVGDSLNRNMYQSLICLLYTSFTPRGIAKRGYTSVWKAQEYNFTLEFDWSPFLIEFNENHASGHKVLVLDKISPNSKKWINADIIVFNSGHWWNQQGKFKAWDMFEYAGKLIKHMPTELAYEHGLKTWATWMKGNIDPNKTTVLFRSISAVHSSSQHDQWCYNKSQPIIDESYVRFYPKSMVDVVENVIKGMRKPKVLYLNITKLSEYRIDAHPSLYRFKDWSTLTKKYDNNLLNYADCSHWCLPGVPDTWNRLFYVSLFFDKLIRDI